MSEKRIEDKIKKAAEKIPVPDSLQPEQMEKKLESAQQKKHVLPFHMQRGWQRRLSIAMALITDPAILFLDEPTLGLDVLARRELWTVISALKGQVTVVLTTHYLEEAEALSDRLGIMVGGKLRALGTVSELCARTGTEKLEDAFVALATEKGRTL